MNEGSSQKIEQLQRKEIVPDVVPSQDKDPKKSQFPYHDTFRAYQQKPLVLSKQDAFRPDHLPTSFIQEERHDMMRRQFEEMNEGSSQKIEQLQRKEIVPDVVASQNLMTVAEEKRAIPEMDLITFLYEDLQQQKLRTQLLLQLSLPQLRRNSNQPTLEQQLHHLGRQENTGSSYYT